MRRAPSEDDLLALMLIATWTSLTGRLLPLGVRPEDLTQAQLIDFWADDQMEHQPTAPRSNR